MLHKVDIDSLNIEERKKGAKTGPLRRDFILEMRDAVKDNPDYFPGIFDKDEFIKVVDHEKHLEDLKTWIITLLEHINDTHLDVGRVAFYKATEAYNYLKSIAGADELKSKMKKYFD